jgi:hypothetical protein
MGKATGHPKCKLCGEEHPLGRCPKFYKSALAEKVREIERTPPKPKKKKPGKRKAAPAE